MRSIRALSLTSYVNNWIADSREPRILHIFDRACNLINERGDVLSIVTPQIGNGPFNIVVDEDICFLNYINIESNVSLCSPQISPGSLTIDIADAILWSPRPDWEKLHAGKDDIGYQLTRLPIMNDLKLDSTGTYSGSRNPQGLQFTQSLVSNLSSSLSLPDIQTSLTAARQLAGLGIGLTPAGDDILMGAISAAWIIHPSEVVSVLAQAIANTATPLTTSLSAAWLKSAGRGEAGILWHDLFNTLLSADSSSVQHALDSILSVGETSGADALTGFLSTVQAWMVLPHPK